MVRATRAACTSNSDETSVGDPSHGARCSVKSSTSVDMPVQSASAHCLIFVTWLDSSVRAAHIECPNHIYIIQILVVSRGVASTNLSIFRVVKCLLALIATDAVYMHANTEIWSLEQRESYESV